MKKLNNTSQIHSDVLKTKNLAIIMEVYAMDNGLYVVNVERENQTIPPSTAISTTDVPTVVKTIHTQSGKKKKKS